MRKRGVVEGVGINDADYEVSSGPRGSKKYCPFYNKWKSMLNRCYSKVYHKRKPTYIGCSVDSRWFSFMSFKSWMEKQDWQGKQLDKDLLVKGNKVYSPETCMFIPVEVNLFMTKADAIRGEYPIGITNQDGKLKVFSGGEYVGCYDNIKSASEAYNKRKYEQACLLASTQPNKLIAKLLMTRYSLQKTSVVTN